jgi:putative pantetheine hydrolase
VGVVPHLVAGARNDLTDVAGVRVGHHHRVGRGWRTGTTVVLPPPGTVAAVDVRGGGPGTRETDALDPRNLVPEVHAVCLTGGSAYGLAAADGVMAWLEERDIGFPVGTEPGQVVPIVPTAVLFDLGRGGAFGNRPDASFGRRAAEAAARPRRAAAVPLGSVGAGTGALAGGLAGGVGSASAVLAGDVTVAALVAVNSVGSVFDPATGLLYGAAHLFPREPGLRRPTRAQLRVALERVAVVRPPANTAIGVVATDADLTKAQAQKMGGVAHDGLARAIQPAHLLLDGDTFFGLATGERALPLPEVDPRTAIEALNALYSAAADVVTRAVVRAVLAADGRPDAPSYRDLFPASVVDRPRR